MFSELTCLWFYIGLRRRLETGTKTGDKPEMPWHLMVIPVLFDLLATPLSMAGLSMVAGSVYSMMRGMVVVFTALFSLLLLG